MPADDGVPRIADAAGSRLEAIRQALNAELRARLARLLADPLGDLQGEKDAIDAARTIRSQVIALMRKEGLPVVLSVAETAIADAVDSVVGPRHLQGIAPQTAGVNVSLDADAMASIERSVSGVLDEVVASFGDGASAMRDAIDVGLSTSAPLHRVIDAAAQALDVTFNKASVAVDSAIRAAGTKAMIMQAERGAEAVGETLYLLLDGPEDSKTRPWCEDHVGKAFPVDVVKRMRNDYGQDASVWRGGFNCRHRWSPLTKEDAIAEGYAT
jgi:hypothetical protein